MADVTTGEAVKMPEPLGDNKQFQANAQNLCTPSTQNSTSTSRLWFPSCHLSQIQTTAMNVTTATQLKKMKTAKNQTQYAGGESLILVATNGAKNAHARRDDQGQKVEHKPQTQAREENHRNQRENDKSMKTQRHTQRKKA